LLECFLSLDLFVLELEISNSLDSSEMLGSWNVDSFWIVGFRNKVFEILEESGVEVEIRERVVSVGDVTIWKRKVLVEKDGFVLLLEFGGADFWVLTVVGVLVEIDEELFL